MGMSLYHKDDIFNYEFTPQMIETELLASEQQRLSFSINFSSYKEDSSLVMQKLTSNHQFTETKLTEGMMFTTFKKQKQANREKGRNDLSITE